MKCFLVADLHGSVSRYITLIETIEGENPDLVFLAGDLLPHAIANAAYRGENPADFIGDFLAVYFRKLKVKLGDRYPRIFTILGNDDPLFAEPAMQACENEGLWEYIHGKKKVVESYTVYGYACTPPSPFQIKDWERYDVSRHLEPGDVSPEEGWHSVPMELNDIRFRTIKKDIHELVQADDLSRSILLLHAPPYKTNLDRAALDGRTFDHAPLDVHVGSTALREFIEDRQPMLTLHGHIHESARIMGDWRDRIGRTHMFTAAHDGRELALVRFDPENLSAATREII